MHIRSIMQEVPPRDVRKAMERGTVLQYGAPPRVGHTSLMSMAYL